MKNMRNNLIAKLTDIAHSAGDVIMPYFRQGAEVEKKPDGSPVTHADREAETLIIKCLKAEWPDIPAVGEESAPDDLSTPAYSRYWLIDPIDGTREFVNNRDEFTVNIALIEEGNPIAGVIYAPAKKLTYTGSLWDGSYKLTPDGKTAKLPLSDGTDGAITVAISRSHPTQGQEEGFLSELKKLMPVNVTLMGSSLKFCMIAEGAAGLYFRAGTTMYWDSAAGHIIVKAAGGLVYEWGSDKELNYNGGSLKNPSFMALRPQWLETVNNIFKVRSGSI